MLKSNLAERGYRPLFRPQYSNACPGCGHSNWYVGRVSAECAFCATAMPIAEAHRVVPALGLEAA